VILSLISLFVFGDLSNDAEFYTYLFAIILVPIMALLHLGSGAIRGQNKIALGQISEQVIFPGSITLILLVISFFHSSFQISAPLAMAIRVISAFIALVVSVFILWKITPKNIFDAEPKKKGKHWFRSTMIMALSNGMHVTKNRTSTLFLGILANSIQVGIFQVANHASMIASIVLQISNWVLAPRFAKLYAEGELKKLQKLITINIRLVFLFNLLITIFFIIFGRWLLIIFFGQESQEAFIPLLILLIGQTINSTTGSVPYLLNMTGHEKETMWGIGAGLVVNVLGNLILVPRIGVNGSALSTAFSLTIAQFVMWWFVRRRIGINSFIINIS